jgi:carboxyl-terminal processing protease
MPWDKIEQAPYRIQKPVSNFETLVANSKKRVAENPQFKLIDENAKWINDRKEDDVVSLNIKKFKAEQAQREEETKKFKAITKFENQLVFNSLSPELELIKKDSI